MPLMTKKLCSDQVLYKLSGGNPDSGFPIDERDIWNSIDQKVNAMFKMQQFSVNLPNGETIPENLAIATYEDVAIVSASSGKSKSTLPVMPISLPKNAGINEIRPVLSMVDSGDKILGSPMVPLLAGQEYLLQADTLLNDLMGQFGYTPNGFTIYYTKDLTVFGITKVDMKLVVMDISQYSVTDILPIPADFEDQLLNDLVAEFSPVTAESGQVNNWTTAGQNVIKQ